MVSRPLVSILIPVYNRRELVRRSIESALAQTYPWVEVVVCDNCSTDGTYEVVQEYARSTRRLKALRHSKNLGPVRNWMSCLKHSAGEYVKFLFSDDWIAPTYVERTLAILQSRRDVGFVFSSVDIHFDLAGGTRRFYQVQLDDGLIPSSVFIEGVLFGKEFPVSPSCALLRRESVMRHLKATIPNRLGIDFTSHGAGVDLLLLLGCSLDFPYVGFVSEALAHFLAHEGSITIASDQRVLKSWYDIAKGYFASLVPKERLSNFPGPVQMAILDLGRRYREDVSPEDASSRGDHDGPDDYSSASNNGPLVTAIVSTYNDARFLEGCLEDLARQTIADKLEIVVVDSGSEQNEREIVASFQQRHKDISVTYIRTEERETVYAAWNRAIQVARGKYLTNANVDDRRREDALELMVAYLDAHPEVALVYADAVVTRTENALFRSPGDVVGFFKWPDYDPKHLFQICYVGPQPMWRRSLHSRYGYFDPTFRSAGDYEFWLRIAQHERFGHLPDLLGLYLWRDSSVEHRDQALSLRESEVARARYWPPEWGTRPAPSGSYFVPAKGTSFQVTPSSQVFEQRCRAPESDALSVSGEKRGPRTVKGILVPSQPPLVSVILPTRDRPGLLRRALRSVADQTVRDFEVIVINDGGEPVDGVVRQFTNVDSRITLVNLPTSRERSAARNVGISVARGRYIAYLDDDDYYYPFHLETALTALSRGHRVVYTDAHRVLEIQQGDHWEPVAKDVPWSQDFDPVSLAQSNYIPIITVVHERACAIEAGGFDERLPVLEDWELWIRLSMRTTFRHISRVTCAFSWRSDGSNTTRKAAHLFAPAREYIQSKHQAFIRELMTQRRTVIRNPQPDGSTGTGLSGTAAKDAFNLMTAGELSRHTSGHTSGPNIVGQVGMAYQPSVPIVSGSIERHGSQPIASIIVPVRNNWQYTQRCLASLAHTRVRECAEVIVVDNGSTDGTQGHIKHEFAWVKIIRNEQNLGFAAACNQAAIEARGQYLVFLNNDTVAQPGWLEALVETAKAPDVGAVGALLLYPDGRVQHAGITLINGIPDHVYRYAKPDAPEVNEYREVDMVTGACLLIHRDLFYQLAGFDEIYENGVEDVDLCLRVRAAGLKVVYQPKAVLYHHEAQTPGRFDRVRENLVAFLTRWKQRFDASGRFMPPTPPQVMVSEQSLLKKVFRLAIRWEGSQFVHHSLALVNRELCLQLIRAGHEVSIMPYEPHQFGPEVDERFRRLAERFVAPLARPADVHVRHQWPPNLSPPPEGHWVIIQPWEYGTIPKEWAEVMATQVDEVWVPSQYVRNCYILSGVPADRVHVVPNGVDPERFHPQAAPLDLSAFGGARNGFRFLFVGGTILRKGIDVLLQAYGKAFTPEDDVCLVIKDMGNRTFYRGQTWEQTIRELQSSPNAPRIVYIDQDLSPHELPGLYTACDCLVHPYRGEGFGLPIAEAMACGLPVIVTGYGAAMDFCDLETAYLIPAVVRKRTDPGLISLEPAGSLWLAEPDVDALAKLMRHVYEHRDEARAKGRRASERIRSHFTWERAAERALARMRALRGQPIRRYEPAAPIPVGSGVGHGPLVLAERRSVHLLMVPDWNDPENCWADALRAFASEFGPEDDVALIVRVDPLETPDPEGVLRRIEHWAEREGINLDGDPLVLILNDLVDPTRRDLVYGTAQVLVDLSDSARGRTLRSEATAHGLVVCRPNRSDMREAYGAVRAAQASQSLPAAPLKR